MVVSTTLYVSRIASKTSTQRIPDWRATCTGQSGSSAQWMTISVRLGSAADLFLSRTLSGREPPAPTARMISSTSRAKSNRSFPFGRRESKGRSFQCSVAGGALGSRRKRVSAWFSRLLGLERTRTLRVCDERRLALRRPALGCLQWLQGGTLFRRGGIAISILLYQGRPKDQ
jgi:hypothetical protein